MDAKLQRRIQRYGWDKAATLYEQSWQEQLEPAQTRLLCMAALAPGERVVDVACGTGLVTFAAADAVGAAGSVLGVDLSETMVDLASARARELGMAHVQFERMDAEELALPSGSFNAALCALGLMYSPRPIPRCGRDDAGAGARRTRGGRCVGPAFPLWMGRDLPIVDAHVQSEVCPMFFSLGTADRLGAVFREAGFTGVITERVETRLQWISADAACGAAFAGGPVALAYSRFDASTRLTVHTAYLESIEPWRNGSRYAVPGEFLIVVGRKPV